MAREAMGYTQVGNHVAALNDLPLRLSHFAHRRGAVLHNKCSKPCREFQSMAKPNSLRVALLCGTSGCVYDSSFVESQRYWNWRKALLCGFVTGAY